MENSKPPPLDGIRVIDVATILAGPLAAQLLGDHGADVIKIEHPERPDGMRGHGPSVGDYGLWWKEISRNKRTVALNIARADGAEVFLSLVRSADVVIENFRPGTLERWGLGPDVLHAANPRLVVLRVSGFGQTGPYAHRHAFGTIVEAMSGFAHLTGEADGAPQLPAFGLADSIAAMAGVNAVMMALYHRDACGGAGQVIDLSLLEPILTAVGPAPTVYARTGEVQQRNGNRSSNNSPRNLYLTSDGQWLAVSTSTNAIAERVITLVGHPECIDEPWFASGAGRAAHTDLLDGFVGEWIALRTADEAVRAFENAGAAIAPVYSAQDVVMDPQVQHRRMLIEVEDQDLGTLLQHNLLYRMSATPSKIRWAGRAHGEDTVAVLTEMGYDADRIAELKGRNVIR